MNILHVIDSGGLYGAEKVLLYLAEAQLKLGLKPVIASIGLKRITEKPIEKEARGLGIPVTLFRMQRGPNLKGAIQIRNYAVNNRFDLLHSHGYKGNILLGSMPRWYRRVPLISTLHGYTSTGEMTRMRLYEWVDRFILPRMDAVVLVSETMKTHPRLQRLKKMNSQVVQNGLPETGPNPKTGTGPHVPRLTAFCENSFIIGAVGRLSHEKGFDDLLTAFGKFSANTPGVKLVILGEGRMRDDLESQIQNLGLTDVVFMPGYVADAAQYMNYFDVFILPSHTEGLPMTLLEAMRASLPIIATSVGGMVAVLRDGVTGLLVPPAHPSALATAMEKVYRDRALCQQLGQAAKQEMITHYSSRKMAAAYLAIYQKTVNGPKEQQEHTRSMN